MRNIYRCVVLFLACSVLLTGCFMSPQESQRKPSHFLGTTWETTDGTVRFVVEGDDHMCQCVGTITVDGEAREVLLWFGQQRNRSMYIMDYDEWVETNERQYFERWKCYFKSEKHFSAIVQESTYFEKGQEFTFYRVEG